LAALEEVLQPQLVEHLLVMVVAMVVLVDMLALHKVAVAVGLVVILLLEAMVHKLERRLQIAQEVVVLVVLVLELAQLSMVVAVELVY
jgi:hypothetical protein